MLQKRTLFYSNPLLFLILLVAFSACDAFYIIPLNEKSKTLTINFECGKVDIYLQNWQGHAFDFYQTFEVHQPVTLNLDSLRIKYKGQNYPCYFIGHPDSVKLTIQGKRKVRTAFQILRNVNKGDTLFVNPNGYIFCNGKSVAMDTLTLVMQENLRGPMGS